MKNKKFLITGANGQLAQSFKKILGTNHYFLNKEELDITNFNKARKIILKKKPDIIVNCAAYNNVDKAEENWKKAFMVNSFAVKNLAIIAQEINAQFVHYSSNYVFDGSQNDYFVFNKPSPINKYGESKLLGESFARNFSERHYVIRTSWLFGFNKISSFPLKLLSWAKSNKKIKIVDDQIAKPTYTEDLVRATLSLLKTKQFGLYHITNKGNCSKYEWAQHILDKVGWDGKLVKAKSSDFDCLAKRPERAVLNNFPFKEISNYKMASWQEATDRFLNKIKK